LIEVSNADRVVFPEVNKTKGDVVAYYDKIATRLLSHVIDRPLSLRRYPKGLSAPGFFQKNVPPHYPKSIDRFEVPRSREASKRHKDPDAREKNVTIFPVLRELEHLPYVANQGAIELHVPTSRVREPWRPDRIVIDLDPPPGALALVRRAAHITREALNAWGLPTVPVATGSKGYHLVANIQTNVDYDDVAIGMHKLATLQAHKEPDVLTTVFRIANRGERVFFDFLRNHPGATVVAPYSLRAKSTATIATPLEWSELESTAPDAFTIDDVDRLLQRPDSLASLAPVDATPFFAKVSEAFDQSGLKLETFDRFRA
jgi:bifunctional non-homologous end joining protein LigD